MDENTLAAARGSSAGSGSVGVAGRGDAVKSRLRRFGWQLVKLGALILAAVLSLFLAGALMMAILLLVAIVFAFLFVGSMALGGTVIIVCAVSVLLDLGRTPVKIAL